MFSPIHALNLPEFKNMDIRIFIKRDDLMFGACQGNKFRKLKYHLLEFHKQKKKEILTFGGAFSNHLFATASTGKKLNIPTIGIIRGEIDEKNPTIRKIQSWGMKLHPVERAVYRKKDQLDFLEQLKKLFPNAYIIPEGGHHPLAQKGVSELVTEVRSQFHEKIDYWACASGTGSTAIGILKKLKPDEKLIAYLVLKGYDLQKTKNELCGGANVSLAKIEVVNAHQGGFGKRNIPLEEFITTFHQQHGILLDPIYTGKIFYQLFSDIRTGKIPGNSTIMAVHSGGLQGIAGYNYRYGTQLLEWDEESFE